MIEEEDEIMSVDDNYGEDDSYTEEENTYDQRELNAVIQKEEDDDNVVVVDDEGERVYDKNATAPGYQLSSLRSHLDFF